MDTHLLSKINRVIRKERPISSQDTICTYYYENNYLEISFENGRCSNDSQGCCTMCDYGVATRKKDVSIFIKEMRKIFFSFEKVDALMLCTNGSFLDNAQIPLEFQKKIIEEANMLPCKILLIETHYQTVSDEKLKFIKKIVKDKKVKIEMSLETTNSLFQVHILNKKIPINELESAIYKIQKYGFIPSINILIGMPFLTTREQVEDVILSVNWCLQHNTEMILFPMNIKPYTLLNYLYMNKLYSPISHWLVIYILLQIEKKYLLNIDIAFWGNREDSYDQKKTIFPLSCEKCHKKIMNFYPKYLSANTSDYRRQCIHDLLDDTHCDCFDRLKNSLNNQSNEDVELRLEKVFAYLEHAFAERI